MAHQFPLLRTRIPTARPSFRSALKVLRSNFIRPTGNNSYANPSVLTNSVCLEGRSRFLTSGLSLEAEFLCRHPPLPPLPLQSQLSRLADRSFFRDSLILVFSSEYEKVYSLLPPVFSRELFAIRSYRALMTVARPDLLEIKGRK